MPFRDHEEAGDGEDGEVWVLFKPVAVFDVAMTEPIPGAEPVALEPPIEPITGDSHAHLLASLSGSRTSSGSASSSARSTAAPTAGATPRPR
jgi:hypothetical protein